MVRYSLLVLMILLSSLILKAQRVELMLSAGGATYSMGDLKKMNESLQKQLPFNTRVTDNFPVTWQWGGHFAVQATKKYKIGVLYAYNSTGSRIASSDYSGSYYFDNIVTGHTIGLLNGFLIHGHQGLKIDFLANIGVVVSNLKLNEELIVSDTTISTSAQYAAMGFFAEPRFTLSYHWKQLITAIYLGYFIDPTAKIKNSDGEKSNTTISWSGFRFGIEVGIGN